MALIEIDALVALALGVSIDDLVTIYRTGFAVLRHRYDKVERYDNNGRLVPQEIVKADQATPAAIPAPGAPAATAAGVPAAQAGTSAPTQLALPTPAAQAVQVPQPASAAHAAPAPTQPAPAGPGATASQPTPAGQAGASTPTQPGAGRHVSGCVEGVAGEVAQQAPESPAQVTSPAAPPSERSKAAEALNLPESIPAETRWGTLSAEDRTWTHPQSGQTYTFTYPFRVLDREADLRAAYARFTKHLQG